MRDPGGNEAEQHGCCHADNDHEHDDATPQFTVDSSHEFSVDVSWPRPPLPIVMDDIRDCRHARIRHTRA